MGFGLDNKSILQSGQSIENALEKIGITEDYVILWGTGETFREFMHVDDLADGCVYIMENDDFKDWGEFINIGTGKDIKINDLATLLKEVIGYEGEVKHDFSRPDGTPRKLLDVNKIRGMGWEAKTGLEEGIRKTYDWYCK